MVPPQPSIEIFGILINEPVTTLTDLVVSAVCFYAFFKLSKISEKIPLHQYLKYYFLSMGLATAIGGLIGHAFFYHFSFYWKLPGWWTSMVAINLIERAVIEYARKWVKPKTARFFAILNIIELLTFMILTFSTLNFFFVEVHSTYGLLLFVASFSGFVYYKTKSKGSKLFLIAVLFAAISALFFMNEWSLHMWFNYLDISHTLMAISAYLFYKGSREIILETKRED
jgi:hypothetical protein